MVNPQNVHSKSLNAKNFNLLMFFNFFVAFVGSLFLAWNDVKAGTIYSLMFLGIIACIFLVTLFLKDDNSLKPITDFVRIPIATSITLASITYILGMILPFVLNLIIKTFSSFQVTSFSIPLFGSDFFGGQSFATAKYGASMSWKIYNIMFVAGNMETLVYNFGLILVFILIGYMILQFVNDGKDLSMMSKKTFILGFAFIMTMIMFVLSHIMNGSYDGYAFLIAGLFILIANFSIYAGGFFLSFWAGYHQSNNLLFLIQTEGLQQVLAGFVSWFGLIFIFYISLIIYHILSNTDKASKELKRWYNS